MTSLSAATTSLSVSGVSSGGGETPDDNSKAPVGGGESKSAAPAKKACSECRREDDSPDLQGNPITLKKCGGCGMFSYCSKACQKKHWRGGHKKTCKTLAAERREGKARVQARKVHLSVIRSLVKVEGVKVDIDHNTGEICLRTTKKMPANTILVPHGSTILCWHTMELMTSMIAEHARSGSIRLPTAFQAQIRRMDHMCGGNCLPLLEAIAGGVKYTDANNEFIVKRVVGHLQGNKALRRKFELMHLITSKFGYNTTTPEGKCVDTVSWISWLSHAPPSEATLYRMPMGNMDSKFEEAAMYVQRDLEPGDELTVCYHTPTMKSQEIMNGHPNIVLTPRETQLLQVHICNGMGWNTANPVTRVQAAARMKKPPVLTELSWLRKLKFSVPEGGVVPKFPELDTIRYEKPLDWETHLKRVLEEEASRKMTSARSNTVEAEILSAIRPHILCRMEYPNPNAGKSGTCMVDNAAICAFRRHTFPGDTIFCRLILLYNDSGKLIKHLVCIHEFCGIEMMVDVSNERDRVVPWEAYAAIRAVECKDLHLDSTDWQKWREAIVSDPFWDDSSVKQSLFFKRGTSASTEALPPATLLAVHLSQAIDTIRVSESSYELIDYITPTNITYEALHILGLLSQTPITKGNRKIQDCASMILNACWEALGRPVWFGHLCWNSVFFGGGKFDSEWYYPEFVRKQCLGYAGSLLLCAMRVYKKRPDKIQYYKDLYVAFNN